VINIVMEIKFFFSKITITYFGKNWMYLQSTTYCGLLKTHLKAHGVQRHKQNWQAVFKTHCRLLQSYTVS